MYMAVQYAFVGIAQTWKNKTHACNNQTATNESTAQKPVFLLEAIPVYNESEGIDTACEAETAEEISETEVIEEAYMAETGCCYPKFRIIAVIQTKILSQLDFLLY